MRRAAFAALTSHWRRTPGQLAALILGLALATGLWSAVQAINAEALASYDRATTVLSQNDLGTLTANGPIQTETFVALRRAGWRVAPVLEGQVQTSAGPVTVIGVDFLSSPPVEVSPDIDPPAPAELLSGEVSFANVTTMDRARALPGLGRIEISDQVPENSVLTDIGMAERVLNRSGQITRLIVLPDQPVAQTPLGLVAPDLTLTPPQAGGDVARLTDSFHLNLTAFGFLSFIVGLFIVHGTIGLAFEQRRPLFRTLRALGLPLAELLGLVLAELMALALIAGSLGLVLGYVIAGVLLPDVAATLQGLYGANVAGSLTFRLDWVLTGLAIALGGTLLAAAQALAKTAHMPLLVAAQPRAWAFRATRLLVWQTLLAVFMLVAAFAIGQFGQGLVTGFALLGALLLGAALLLPPILALALALGQRWATSAIAEWFWADTRQQMPGLSLALMALLLALAANIGVGTMVSSFRLTFVGWLDQRLASEFYVYARSTDEAALLQEFLRPRVETILPVWSVETRLNGAPAEIYGVVDDPTYRDNWPLLSAVPNAWDKIAAGTGVLINEQLFYREDLSPGDPIQVEPGWQSTIAGVYSDYGNPAGQIIAGFDALRDRYPDSPITRFGVRLDASNVPALRQALIAEFGLPGDAMTDQAALKALSLRIFERTFTVTAALNVLTLSVAALAILIGHATLSAMRLPQLAPAWALGLTRRHLAWLELWRTVILAAITAVFALPVGLVLAWVLLTVVNVEAFGWRLPMHVFPVDWVMLFVLALLAAAVAALLPSRRMARLAPSEFLKVFANER